MRKHRRGHKVGVAQAVALDLVCALHACPCRAPIKRADHSAHTPAIGSPSKTILQYSRRADPTRRLTLASAASHSRHIAKFGCSLTWHVNACALASAQPKHQMTDAARGVDTTQDSGCTFSGWRGRALTRTLWSLSVLTRRDPSGDRASDVTMLQKWPSSSCGLAPPCCCCCGCAAAWPFP